MIICSCNVITDHAIRNIVTTTDLAFGSPAQVYDCLGCAVQCGQCSRSVKRILEEKLTNGVAAWSVGRADRYQAAGNANENVAPPSGALAATSSPPCSRTMP
ncbi:(2Fe-2S)-binding protein [Bradyrhizobium sp. STM 3843]|uniref:(2Fe-2S)-binding protein n=1 Tax=Bradyrhizobium sp. STM 3843 TaxID=551947 RepID=UPI0009FDEB4C|nr:(2Fe-2S)-binding protein [Bradyrhizobium sp. STM 3843]